MFSYHKKDRTTYTDPALVAHLVKHLRANGYTDISVAEAQSSYGAYFDNRSVHQMAEYLGYDGQSAGYTIVDLTLDATAEHDFGPTLKGIPYRPSGATPISVYHSRKIKPMPMPIIPSP